MLLLPGHWASPRTAEYTSPWLGSATTPTSTTPSTSTAIETTHAGIP